MRSDDTNETAITLRALFIAVRSVWPSELLVDKRARN